ncbi:prune-like protein 2 [Cryptotermes secundus]|uniref:Prune-like protein 2 n=1 Tax=Cryptotermes secundus TaxID=105785 RepID=A0A2J7RLA3_9NEOP|nr:prune-like protein 2 [Cryptotermes secundus]
MSSENGETQNDTLTESDKMDISEVSDQVSPLSEQSLSETVDNPAPKDSVPVGFVSLDNASAAVSPTSTNTTTTATANTARDRLDSALSLEGFDLELPTLDTYQEEYVDFPSSPKQLKECLEAHGMAMPLERDSGTTGRSEEEDEEDTSIYQAVLSPDCQDVRLKKERPGSLVAPQRGGRRKIRVSADILTGNGSGGDTTVNGDESSGESHLSDMDMMSPDDDPDLDALLSPDLDTPDEMEDSIMERLGEPPPARVPIPELSATEERAEARSWRNVLVAGLERRIDMKVIEPYKRVLSHGGYLSAGSHNAIIVFSACFLPDRSRVDYDYVMDNLFFYVLTTLDELITEDYVLIYLHGATSRSCMPTFSWLKRCYQMIDRRLRKNLKGLYLVHPTFWLKTIVIMTRPFISSKFSRKLNFVDTLAELAEVVPLEQASIPDRVKQYDQIRQSMEQGN